MKNENEVRLLVSRKEKKSLEKAVNRLQATKDNEVVFMMGGQGTEEDMMELTYIFNSEESKKKFLNLLIKNFKSVIVY